MGADITYIDISSIDSDSKSISTPSVIRGEAAPTRARQWVRAGDVLVSMTRPNLNAVALVPPALAGAVCSTGFDVLRAQWIEPRWLYFAVQSGSFVDAMCACVQGVVYPAVRPRDVRAHEIPLPPLAEQRRIVDALETHFTRLDAAVATLERVRANLKRHRAAVLQAAVEGRLIGSCGVRLDAGREGAESLPEGWRWSALADLCESITDGDHMPPPQAPTGVPFLVIGDVRTGAIDFTGARFVSKSYFDALDASRRPRRGDMLYTVTGSFGIPVRVNTDRPFCVQRHIAILRPRRQVGARFLALWLATPYVLRQVTRVATGTAQKTVGLRPLRNIAVPVPPEHQRNRIAEAAEQALSIGAAADAQIVATEARVARLRQSLLRTAFEGHLVPQDLNEDPAEALLARIRAERSPMSSTTSRRGRSRASRNSA